MVGDRTRGFNDLAAETAVRLLGDVRSRAVLDIGCGEGHIARRLARLGARVTGTEPTPALLAAARSAEADEPLGIDFGAQPVEDLSGIPTGSQDAVCAVLVHHVRDLPQALQEVRRVLGVRGMLVAVLPHPWTDHPGAHWTTPSRSAEAPPRRVLGDYLDEGFWSSGSTGTAGLSSVRDIGWYHRSLATWFTAVATADFALSEVLEPTGEESARPDRGGPWAGVPRLLAFRAVRC